MLDINDASGLGWDDRSRSGVVFHMISGVAVAGRLGLTAIANSAADADALHAKCEAVLTSAAATVFDN